MVACLVVVAGCLAAGLLVGCSRQDAGDYDSLPTQLLADYFAATATGDGALIQRQLKRLEDIAPGEPFVIQARQYEIIRDAINRCNRALVVGKLAEARAALNQVSTVTGTTSELRQCESLLAALTAIEAYVGQQPFRDLATASRALAAVQAHRAALQEAPAFQEWIKTQENLVSELRRAALTRQANQVLQDLDLLVLNDAGDTEAVLRRLDELLPETPGLPVLLAVFRNRAPGWATVAGRVANWNEPLPRLALEIGMFRHRDHWSSDLRQLALAQFRQQPPQSLSGLAAGARLAAAAGQHQQAALWADKLLSSTDVPVPLMVEGLRQLLSGPAQFQAKAWRTPFPSFPDFLVRAQALAGSVPATVPAPTPAAP